MCRTQVAAGRGGRAEAARADAARAESARGQDDRQLAAETLRKLWSKRGACDAGAPRPAQSATAPDADTRIAAALLRALWARLAARGGAPAACVDGAGAAEQATAKAREVRWMASGGVVCSVPAGASARVAAVEAAVRERAGVPEREQRLFVDGQELSVDAVLSDNNASTPVLLVRAVSDPRITDLTHFHPSATFDLVPAGFKMVKRITQGINGDIFRYRMRQDGSKACEDVAVKKFRSACLKRPKGTESDERAVHLEPWKNAPPEEDALTEIGVLLHLSEQSDLPEYLLRMVGCFADTRHTWLVTEFADGGELFDRVAAINGNEDKVRRYSWQLLQAVEYLHRHHIGHRDISLENVLLKADTVKLMDFGLAVRSHSDAGTPLRYFRAAGKNFYRAPECNVPLISDVRVVAPLGSTPDEVVMVNAGDGYLCEVRLPAYSVPGVSCRAAVWGYAVQPVDIFATGVSICIMCCGFPLWKKALLLDPTFAYVNKLGDEGIASVLTRWQKPLPPSSALQLLKGMMRTDAPSKRLSARDCLASPWFAALSGADFQVGDAASAEAEQ